MEPDAAIPERISAWAVELPMRNRFVSAGSVLSSRRVILVKLDLGGHIGWGEAAPVPGHSAESFSTVWSGLRRAADLLMASGEGSIGGIGAAAISQARTDLGARRADVALWRHLGGSNKVWASAAIGLDAAGRPDRATLAEIAATGYRHAKLKITSKTPIAWLRQLAEEFATITMGLDANGSLDLSDRRSLAAIDDLGFAFIEQPGPAEDLRGHRRARELMATPIALDESAHSLSGVQQIMAREAADIITLKAGRFGTTETLDLAKRIVGSGFRVRLGGLLESGVGRAHDVALATCDEFSVFGDIAGSDLFFSDDLVAPPWRVNQGRLQVSDQPGIGVLVDEEAIARSAIDVFDRYRGC